MKFLFFFIIFKIFLSNETLRKYSSITISDNSILFISSGFSKEDKINFKIEIVGNSYGKSWKNQLNYEFYDNKNNVNHTYAKYIVYATSSQNNDATRFFTIYKNYDYLDGLRGDYLLLIFNCDSSATIENIEKSYESLSSEDSDLLIIKIIFPILFILMIILMCWDALKIVLIAFIVVNLIAFVAYFLLLIGITVKTIHIPKIKNLLKVKMIIILLLKLKIKILSKILLKEAMLIKIKGL